MDGEFSVYWWTPEGVRMEEVRFVDAGTAMHRVRRLTHGPCNLLGAVHRVIITDGGDCINFEWVQGRGMIFPTKEMIEEML